MSSKIVLEEKDGQTEFDVILVGTGIVESILSCALSRAGKKILHLDANRFYGSNFASLNLKQYKSYIDGKLDELPSFRSDGKTSTDSPFTLTQIESIVPHKNIEFESISFLNSLTSPKNVFGNFDCIEPITNYKEAFCAYEEKVLQNRYRVQYQIGYTFNMKDKNGLLIYRIAHIISNDIYECHRVFITQNRNALSFPSIIYLSFDQLPHTKTYSDIQRQPRNTMIFKLNDVLYYKCINKTLTDIAQKDNIETRDEYDTDCVCRAIVDETKAIMFYEYENEIDCIIGMIFELKKMRYEIIDITDDQMILCRLCSDRLLYGEYKKSKPVVISFNMKQMADVIWIKPRKTYKRNNTQNEEEWDENTDYKDDDDWKQLVHLRRIFHCYHTQYRKICIDFIPNMIYSAETLIEVLVRSKVSTYMEFRGINKNFIYSDNLAVIKVPLTRSDVFITKALTFLEKRQLTKFMQSVLNNTFDTQHDDDMAFSTYITSQNVSDKLNKFIRYALAFLDCPDQDPTANDMLYRLRLFLKSIGRFSSGSFLYPLYGCGDLAPGFVRSSAVKGGIFILDWNPKAIIMHKIQYHDVLGKNGYVFWMDGRVYVKNVLRNNKEYECVCLLDGTKQVMDMVEFERLYKEDKIVCLIGRRFYYGERIEYEVVSMTVYDDDIVIKCDLTPQIVFNEEMYDAAKCIYLSLEQLLYVKWVNMERNEGIMEGNKAGNDDEKVMRCTGIITASDQYIKTRYFVAAADYFADTIQSVSVKHCRMTVISDGPIVGTIYNRAMEQDNDDSSDSDDSDKDDEEKEKGKEEKESVSDSNNCCVVHIPPNTVPFNNRYSIHMIQLDHYSCTVPIPLCLTFFWMQCGDDIDDAKQCLQRCFDIFYRRDVIVDKNEEKRPLGLMRTIYEQRIRTVNTDTFPDNVFIVEDLSDTIGWENAVQSAKSLFVSMFPHDPWMEPDKVEEPKETRADKVFSALEDDKQKEDEQVEEVEQATQTQTENVPKNDTTKDNTNDTP